VVAGTTTGCIKVIYILSEFLVRWSDKQLTATSTNINIPILTATQLPNMSHLILQTFS
jgi:DNA polymerase III sliding clamp (beta) subunit (PCNA family)